MLSLNSRSRFRAIAMLLPLFVAAALEGQTVSWVQVAFTPHPYARSAAAVAFDASTRSALVFGGANDELVLGDTWTWNGSWREMFPSISPPARQGAAIAYDGATGEVVLFGGSPTAPVGSGTAFGDTWTWNGIAWTPQSPAVSPPARVWSTMVYVPETKTVLLFGGTNSSGANNSFDDTWAWNGVTRTWTQLKPADYPSPRTISQLVYDPISRNVVLFGGVTSNLTPLNDTWTWNGVNWAPRSPASSPSALNSPSLVYDAALKSVVLFGGAVGTCCSDNLNDTWTWNGADWTEIFPPAPLPPGRNGANMLYDPANNSALLFGGASNGPAIGDYWFLTVAQ